MTDDCPAPDCEESFAEIDALLEHVNSEHAGEYTREDWPDTAAGRASRHDESDDEE